MRHSVKYGWRGKPESHREDAKSAKKTDAKTLRTFADLCDLCALAVKKGSVQEG